MIFVIGPKKADRRIPEFYCLNKKRTTQRATQTWQLLVFMNKIEAVSNLTDKAH